MRLRRGSERFLYQLNNLLGMILDYQEGRISDIRQVILSIKPSEDRLGRRQEDLCLEGVLLTRSERILLNLERYKNRTV